MKELKINHLAVLVCVVVASVIGFLWYGPLLGEKWMSLEGLDPEVVAANPPGAATWITNLIATIVPAYVLAWIFTKINVKSGLEGATYAFAMSFAFNLLARMTNDMFAGNPYELSWIVGGNNILALTVMGFILGAWRKYKE